MLLPKEKGEVCGKCDFKIYQWKQLNKEENLPVLESATELIVFRLWWLPFG